ncbi:hypothetical protein HMPREF2811_08150 [Globicatella sp. HMSC072A10]|uniref:restriction endonuclease subunit S n=1 Tax=Globicatella sp. HMSC072A10 TaxID=1739315 RepID=UPI0008B3C52D|nr:restriction endonuclease subunit S [Globicatella sp. HMSC072A10]OFK53698.1 hypothetical protein HMPREF2811_08150 [Globicatella sp. HMSC072A10]
MIDTELLKEKVLDLAMRGKLVEQDPTDGDARDLLQEIQAEREQLVKEKKIKKSKPLPPISEEEIPYEIPESWEWVRLEDVQENIPNAIADGPFGSDLKKIHYTDEKQVRIIQLSNVSKDGWKDDNVRYTTFEHLKNIQRSEVNEESIVITKMMPAGVAMLVPGFDQKYVLSSDVVKFVPNHKINANLLVYFLNGKGFQNQVKSELQGTTRKRTAITKLRKYILPIPSRAEQERILEKIEYLFSIIDVINKSQIQYEDYKGSIKGKILELAMQGKLVPQLPEEGIASTLLEEIAAERQRLVDEKKIKKAKPLPEITQEEIPYKIPESWEWVRLGNVIYPQKTVKEKPEEFYYIDISSINNELQKIENPEFISAEGSPSRASKYVEEGDVVFSTVRPYLKNIAVLTSEYKNVIASTGFYVMRGIGKVNNEFLFYLSQSEYFLGSMTRMMRGDNSPSVRNNDLEEFVIPLPPADEQVRIVNKLKDIRQNI